jgi:hypothetical protein
MATCFIATSPPSPHLPIILFHSRLKTEPTPKAEAPASSSLESASAAERWNGTVSILEGAVEASRLPEYGVAAAAELEATRRLLLEKARRTKEGEAQATRVAAVRVQVEDAKRRGSLGRTRAAAMLSTVRSETSRLKVERNPPEVLQFDVD